MNKLHVIAIFFLFLLAAVFQLTQGRLFLGNAADGTLYSLEGAGKYNSQTLFDPYTFSHIIHGFIFFYAIGYVSKRFKWNWSLGTQAVIATLIEVSWEIVENTTWIIERYRAQTSSWDYFGDSIINSASDSLFMLIGFYMAYKLGWKYILALILLFELGTLWWIKDNLAINVIMIVYPLEVIKNWQMGM